MDSTAPVKKVRQVSAPSKVDLLDCIYAVEMADRQDRNTAITKAIRKFNMLLKPELLAQTRQDTGYYTSVCESVCFKNAVGGFLRKHVPKSVTMSDFDFVSEIVGYLNGDVVSTDLAASDLAANFPATTVTDLKSVYDSYNLVLPYPSKWSRLRNSMNRVVYSNSTAEISVVMDAVKALLATLNSFKVDVPMKAPLKRTSPDGVVPDAKRPCL